MPPREEEAKPISGPVPPSRTPRSAPGLTTWVDVRVRCSEDVRADEQILRRGLPAVRVAVLNDRAVTVGVGVSPEARFLAAVTHQGIPVVRRTTGGTALLHLPGDLAWSVILPREDPRVGADYVHGFARFGAGVVRFLGDREIEARWGDPPGTDPDYCLLSARGSVLLHKELVLGGAAQHLSGTSLLHHGILPLELDRPLLGQLFGLPASSLDRLTSLRELGIEGEPEELAWKLAARLSDALSGR